MRCTGRRRPLDVPPAAAAVGRWSAPLRGGCVRLIPAFRGSTRPTEGGSGSPPSGQRRQPSSSCIEGSVSGGSQTVGAGERATAMGAHHLGAAVRAGSSPAEATPRLSVVDVFVTKRPSAAFQPSIAVPYRQASASKVRTRGSLAAGRDAACSLNDIGALDRVRAASQLGFRSPAARGRQGAGSQAPSGGRPTLSQRSSFSPSTGLYQAAVHRGHAASEAAVGAVAVHGHF